MRRTSWTPGVRLDREHECVGVTPDGHVAANCEAAIEDLPMFRNRACSMGRAEFHVSSDPGVLFDVIVTGTGAIGDPSIGVIRVDGGDYVFAPHEASERSARAGNLRAVMRAAARSANRTPNSRVGNPRVASTRNLTVAATLMGLGTAINALANRGRG